MHFVESEPSRLESSQTSPHAIRQTEHSGRAMREKHRQETKEKVCPPPFSQKMENYKNGRSIGNLSPFALSRRLK